MIRSNLIQLVHTQFGLHINQKELAFVLFGQKGKGRQVSVEEFTQAVWRVKEIYGKLKRPLELWALLQDGLRRGWALKPTAAEERRIEEERRNPYVRLHYPEDDTERIAQEKERQIREMKKKSLVASD